MNGPKNWNVAIFTHFELSFENFSKSCIICDYLTSSLEILDISGNISTHAFLTLHIESWLSFLKTGMMTPRKICSPITLLILISLVTSSLLILNAESSCSDTKSYIKCSRQTSSPSVSQSSSIRTIEVSRRSSSSSWIQSKMIGRIKERRSYGVRTPVIKTSCSRIFGRRSALSCSSMRSG